ncbi:MAG: hypothetical protein WDW36_009778 [Sanguina aurantia]
MNSTGVLAGAPFTSSPSGSAPGARLALRPFTFVPGFSEMGKSEMVVSEEAGPTSSMTRSVTAPSMVWMASCGRGGGGGMGCRQGSRVWV